MSIQVIGVMKALAMGHVATPSIETTNTESVIGHALVTGMPPKGMPTQEFTKHVLGFDWEGRANARAKFGISNFSADKRILRHAMSNSHGADADAVRKTLTTITAVEAAMGVNRG